VIAPSRLVPRDTLTRRPLPEHDDTIALLTERERRMAAAIWQARGEAELRASMSFAYIARELVEAGAAPELVALAQRAVTDEIRHGEICRRVASAFAGRELPELRRLPLRVPMFPGVSAELVRVFHVVGMSCLNETTGSAFLEVCRAGACGPLVSRALHELLSDEIDHARIGWAFVASNCVSDATRAELTRRMPELIAMNLAAWRERPRFDVSDALVGQGIPRWDDVDRAVVAAIDELFVPGFASVGIAI
jgi:hypothetical protein